MDDFILYFQLGLQHVLDLKAYDHILFLIVLAVVFSSSQWKKALWLITFFTVGHTLTLGLAAYEVIHIKVSIVEFLIPVTIFITGFANILRAGKASTGREKLNLFFALFFGLVHGLGFSNYFRMMIGKEEGKFFPLLEFALGIELSQVIIVFSLIVIGSLLQRFFKLSKRDWVLVTSSIVVGITVPMMIERVFW
jgi:hydrogenase/urease accessory protein HupE